VLHRAGTERFWSLCGPSAAKLESMGAGVKTVITVMTVMKTVGKFGQTETGE
jgi:hypothetical protein